MHTLGSSFSARRAVALVATRIVIGPTVACLEFGHVSPVPPKDLRHKVTCARSAAGDCTYLHQHAS